MDLKSYGYSLWIQKRLFENKSLEVAGLKIRSVISAAIFMAHSLYKDDKKVLEQALKVLRDRNERDFIMKSLISDEKITIQIASQSIFLDKDLKIPEAKEEEFDNSFYQKMLIDANNYLNSTEDIEEIATYLQLLILWK